MATVRNDHEYGKQRLWGTLGWGLLSPLAGWAVGRFGVGQGGFLGYAAGSVACFVVCLAVDFSPLYTTHSVLQGGSDDQEANVSAPLLGGHHDATSDPGVFQHCETPSLLHVLSKPASIAWLLLSATMGYGIGAIENFFFLSLEDLGAHPLLMGFDLAVTCAAEAPVFFLSSHLYRHVSVETALQIVLLAYVIRMGAYVALPLLPSFWCILPVDLLHGVTFGIGWSAGTIEAARLAPSNLRATMQSVFQATFSGLGYGTGGLVSGWLYHQGGGRAVFSGGVVVIVAGWLAYVVLRGVVVWGRRTRTIL